MPVIFDDDERSRRPAVQVLADGQAAISDASAKLTELIENLDLSGTQTQLSTLVDILGGDPAVYGQYFS